MSSEWVDVTLGDVTTWLSGGTPKKEKAEFWGGTIPWISASSMQGTRYSTSDLKITSLGLDSGSRLAPKNAILLLVRGSALHNKIPVGIALKDVAFNQDVKALLVNEARITPWFLLYWLLSQRDYLLENVVEFTGIGAGKLDTKRMQTLPLRLPSLKEQDDLVLIVKTLDDRIENLSVTKVTLEAIAQALFKSWFVDFDPVRAKAEGREPEWMDAETAALFPDSFEESELGLAPRGWKLAPFGQLLSHTVGGDWGDDIPSDKNNTRVAIIRGTDIPDLHVGQKNRVPIRYTSQKKLTSRLLQDGDLVLEISGGSKDQPTGRCLYITSGILGQFDCPIEPASFCRLLRPINHEIGVLLSQHMTFIYGEGKTWGYQNQSTGLSNFQTAHFLQTELVPLPPENILRAFASLVRPMVDRSHLTQSAKLEVMRDTLLPCLISGQLRISKEMVT